MVLIGVLMVSHVPYSKFPKIGLKSARGLAMFAVVLAAMFGAVAVPRYFFFAAGLLYIAWGLMRSVLLGLLDRLPGGDPLLDTDEDEVDDGSSRGRDVDYADLGPGGRRRTFEDEDSDHDPEDRF